LLVEFFLKAHAGEGDVVFDAFPGSGATMGAAHVLSRIGYGCEITLAHCDASLRRILGLAGVEPVLPLRSRAMPRPPPGAVSGTSRSTIRGSRDTRQRRKLRRFTAGRLSL